MHPFQLELAHAHQRDLRGAAMRRPADRGRLRRNTARQLQRLARVIEPAS